MMMIDDDDDDDDLFPQRVSLVSTVQRWSRRLSDNLAGLANVSQ